MKRDEYPDGWQFPAVLLWCALLGVAGLVTWAVLSATMRGVHP